MGDILGKNPKELACLGFNVADLDISFKKSQCQFTAYYKDVKHYNKKICDKFLDELRKQPQKVMDQFGDEKNPFMKALKDSQAKVKKDLVEEGVLNEEKEKESEEVKEEVKEEPAEPVQDIKVEETMHSDL